MSETWMYVAGGLVAAVGGWYVPFLRAIYVAGFKAMLSEAVLKKVFISVAEKLVKSSKNKLDDIWFAQMKKNL
tara:strand:- start:408 stop:626 length:219 start_codon:yes stop_codon:yes gene_type:complete